MKKPLVIAISTVLGALIAQNALASEEATSIEDMVKGSEVELSFRYRYENVDVSNSAKSQADASTLKTTISVLSKTYKGFQWEIEADDVSNIGSASHFDGANGLTQYETVLDPEHSAVNQSWISYSGVADTTLKYGRQRINLDNQRFVGGVAWRQNEQTFDATAVINKSLPDTTVFLAHVTRIHDITGHHTDTHSNLINVAYEGFSFGKLSAYGYQLKAISDTYGVRLAGNVPVADIKLAYEAEYASQSENSQAAKIDADYTHFSVGAEIGPVNAKLGHEVLGAANGTTGSGFETPLGTKHKFNGWADQFLGTGANGLRDTYVSASGKVADIKLMAVYHDFDADKGGVDQGSEIDLSASKKVMENLNILLKYADYSGTVASGKSDTRKLWLQAQLSF